MLKWRPSKFQLGFGLTASSLTALYVYDRQQMKTIQAEQIAQARVLAQQPMPLHQLPRKLTLVVSAVTEDDGIKLNRAFERYVKPIWDAGALDYETIELWEWHKSVRERVKKDVLKRWEKWTDIERQDKELWDVTFKEIQERVAEEGGDGYVCIGRPGFKGLVVGMMDVLNEVQGTPELQAKEDLTPKNTRTWLQWWQGKPKEQDETQMVQDPTETESEPMLFDSKYPLPVIGYVPYIVPRWINRMIAFFNNRHYARTMGDASLYITLGYHANMSEMFPGFLLFKVEKSEHKEKGKDEEPGPADEINEVLVPEEFLQKMRFYTFK